MSESEIARVYIAAGVELDVTRMYLPDELDSRYRHELDRAVCEMQAVEAGDKVNQDEGWQVGHYWLRNPDLAPTGYGDWIRSEWDQIDKFATEKFDGRFSRILWIGIGGSGLGPQMLYDALRTPGKTPRMFFFDNTDPYGMHRTLLEIEQAGGLTETLTVVVSKSGGTKESANGMLVAMQEYEKAGLEFAEHAAAITKSGSKLDKLAGPESKTDPDTHGAQWLARFRIWDWVGGRTSLLSAVGMLPARLLGFDGMALREGARAMDDATRERAIDKNLALMLATVWYHTVETMGLRNMVVLPYSDRISMLSKYLQQLVMESLGKEGKGITVFGNKGSTDQHSYVQQLRDGYRDFFVMFLRVLDPETDNWEVEPGITAGDYLMAFQEGTAQALSDTGRLSLRATVEHLNESTLGALIALYERAVGYYGAMLGINAYHQPDVEAGKQAAARLIDLQRSVVAELGSSPTTSAAAAEIAATVGASESEVSEIVQRLAKCGRGRGR